MEGYYAIYDEKKEYTTADGKIYTKEMFYKNYPVAYSQQMAVFLYGNTIDDGIPVSYLLGKHGIGTENIEEGIKKVNEMVRLKSDESTPIERIAASLEYLVLLFMEDSVDEF